MKYHELTEEQRKHFDYLINTNGEPHEEATHFDMNDGTDSSWTKITEIGSVFYLEGGDWKYWHNPDTSLVEIPEKPWAMPSDKEDCLVEIGKKYKVIEPTMFLTGWSPIDKGDVLVCTGKESDRTMILTDSAGFQRYVSVYYIKDGFIAPVEEENEDYVSTPEEEEALMKIAESAVTENDEKVACDLCIAMHIQKLQEFMKESGTKLELVIHKDFIAINDNGDEYRPKEGGVGTLIDYVHTRGKLDSIAEKLEV